jgi:hypothetical protein
MSDMSARTLLLAGGLLAASLNTALADNVTATVRAWDPAGRTLTLDDQTQFVHIPSKVVIPPGLKVNDKVTIEFTGSENGVDDFERIILAK